MEVTEDVIRISDTNDRFASFIFRLLKENKNCQQLLNISSFVIVIPTIRCEEYSIPSFNHWLFKILIIISFYRTCLIMLCCSIFGSIQNTYYFYFSKDCVKSIQLKNFYDIIEMWCHKNLKYFIECIYYVFWRVLIFIYFNKFYQTKIFNIHFDLKYIFCCKFLSVIYDCNIIHIRKLNL